MQDLDRSAAVLGELRALGVRLALDDFGTGYSSLAYLRHLEVDRLKIDRSFMAELDGAAAEQTIVAAIVGMARGLGLAVTAEGIETEEQLALAARAGLRRGAGLPARPPGAARRDRAPAAPAARHGGLRARPRAAGAGAHAARRQRHTGVGSDIPLSHFIPAADQREAGVARGPLVHRRVGDHRRGTRALGQPGREVDRPAVVVAPAPQRRTMRDAGVDRREVLPLGLGRLHQAERGVEQRRRLRRDEHHRVADRLDEPHRRNGHMGRDRGQPRGDRAEVGRGHALAEPGEADEVAEADASSRARPSAARPRAPPRR